MLGRYIIIIGGILCFLLSVFSCEDKIDRSDIYTFTGQMASDYINSNPDLSKFARIMAISRNSHNRNSSTVSSLLGTRGFYTVLAPDNHAIDLYFDSIYGRHDIDLDTLPRRVADDIVLNCVIDLTDDANPRGMMVMSFYEGYIAEATLDDHRLYASFGDWGDGCILKFNRKSRVIKGNIEVENGYVHIVDRVITPGVTTIPGLLREADNMRIFSLLLSRTSWADSLLLYEDKSYHDSVYKQIVRDNWNTYQYYPEYRMYGYTAFVEPDEVFQADWGVPAPRIDSLGRMENEQEILSVIEARCRETYKDATDEDYTSQDNAVNRFVSYHLLNCKRDFYYLVQYLAYHYGWFWDPPELNGWIYPSSPGVLELAKKRHEKIRPINEWYYYPTMGTPARIMKITKLANTEERRINRHSYYDNSYFGSYQETSVAREGMRISKDNHPYDNECQNGFYFPINHVLLYDDYTRHAVLNERIRYNSTQVFPELLTDLPGHGPLKENGRNFTRYKKDSYIGFIPLGNLAPIHFSTSYQYYLAPGYLENLENTKSIISSPIISSKEFNGECLLVYDDDIVFPLLPVPYAGNWEVRICEIRCVADVYMGEGTRQRNRMRYLGRVDNLTKNRYIPPHELEVTDQIYGQNTTATYSELTDSMQIIENDKICRQHNMMKGPYSLEHNPQDMVYLSERNSYEKAISIRRRQILYRGYMRPDKTYYIWIHAVLTSDNITRRKGFMSYYDYLELVPECVYNNPNRSEDFW